MLFALQWTWLKHCRSALLRMLFIRWSFVDDRTNCLQAVVEQQTVLDDLQLSNLSRELDLAICVRMS
jgi:hypothetical protein